jgi:hypothetical protein
MRRWALKFLIALLLLALLWGCILLSVILIGDRGGDCC